MLFKNIDQQDHRLMDCKKDAIRVALKLTVAPVA